MLVTVEDGRAVAVRGDPEHPFTRGGLCVKVNNYEQRVYSPDRVLHPLKRSGPKGTGQFERISWDEAVEMIRDRWTGIIGNYGPTAILPYSYLGTEGILNGLNVGDAFFNRLGATISERTFCDSGSCTAYFMTIGPSPGMDPERFKHSKYIILWACNTGILAISSLTEKSRCHHSVTDNFKLAEADRGSFLVTRPQRPRRLS